MARRLLVLLLALILAAVSPESASAHAGLVHSIPAAGEVFVQPPSAAELEFSETVDARFTRARLTDENGQVLADIPGEVAPHNPLIVHFPLPSLKEGVYSLEWSVRSAVDGHVTSGLLAFSVGLNTPRASLLPPPGVPLPTQVLPTVADVLIRWLNYLSLSLAAGGVFFALLVWFPAARMNSTQSSPADSWFYRFLRPLVITGIVGAFTGSLALVVLQAYQTTSPFSPFWWRVLELINPQHAGIFWGRMMLLAFLGMMFNLPSPNGTDAGRAWKESGVLAGLLLLTYSLSGHSAALGSILPVAVDWSHMLAAAIWLGGLLILALLLSHSRGGRLPEVTPAMPMMIRRFSLVALICVLVLALSGLYSSIVHVEDTEALFQTRYGQGVILKISLLALLVAFGAVNRLFLIPALSGKRDSTIRRGLTWLSTILRFELLAGAAALLTAGFLLSVPPAAEALHAQEHLGTFKSWREGPVKFDLAVAPASIGDNEFAVDIIDGRRGADQVPPLVLMRFRYLERDKGVTQAEAEHTTANRYTVRGSYFPSNGRWQVEIILRKDGFDDVRHAFDILVTPPSPMEH